MFYLRNTYPFSYPELIVPTRAVIVVWAEALPDKVALDVAMAELADEEESWAKAPMANAAMSTNVEANILAAYDLSWKGV